MQTEFIPIKHKTLVGYDIKFKLYISIYMSFATLELCWSFVFLNSVYFLKSSICYAKLTFQAKFVTG